MVRDEQRRARSLEEPIVGGLPNAPGIVAVMRLSPGLAENLRGLADELLVKDVPGTTLTRPERELLATAVSAANDCFYCMDTHGAFATEAPSTDKCWSGRWARRRHQVRTIRRPRRENGRSARHRPHGPTQSSQLDARRGCPRARGWRHRRGYAARRPHRFGILHVQPHGGRLASSDTRKHRRVPCASGRDSRLWVRRPKGEVDSRLTARGGPRGVSRRCVRDLRQEESRRAGSARLEDPHVRSDLRGRPLGDVDCVVTVHSGHDEDEVGPFDEGNEAMLSRPTRMAVVNLDLEPELAPKGNDLALEPVVPAHEPHAKGTTHVARGERRVQQRPPWQA